MFVNIFINSWGAELETPNLDGILVIRSFCIAGILSGFVPLLGLKRILNKRTRWILEIICLLSIGFGIVRILQTLFLSY